MENNKETGKKAGRPRIAYDSEFHCLLVEGLLRRALTEAETAEEMDISLTTLKTWKKTYPEFMTAVKKGKMPVNYQIENSMIKIATGFEYDEIKTYMSETEEGKKIKRVEKITKYYPPSSDAGKFLLKNRMPDEYKDSIRQEVTGKDGKAIETKNVNLSLEDLKNNTEVTDFIKKLYE